MQEMALTSPREWAGVVSDPAQRLAHGQWWEGASSTRALARINLSISDGSWPGPGGATDLVEGSKQMNQGFTFPPSHVTTHLAELSQAPSSQPQPKDAPGMVLLIICCSFDQNHTSFHVTPPPSNHSRRGSDVGRSLHSLWKVLRCFLP